MARYINEAKAERSAAEAELAIVDRDRPPTAAELFAVIEELRDDLAALAAADDPAEKAETYRRLDESKTLDGGNVLPGFKLSIRRWFERAARGGGAA